MTQVADGHIIAPPSGWQIAGIFVGGCVVRGPGSSFRRQAHAHNSARDPHKGWICIRSARRVWTLSGQPSRLLLHEYAHILTPSAGHGPAWQKRVAELGAPSEARRFLKIQAARKAARV